MKEMAAVTTAAAVANTFLDLQANDTSQFPPIDQMKLQKLIFYAYAWWLGTNEDDDDSQLFDEDVEAWAWGPVVRSIYVEFNGFGRDKITTHRATILVKSGDNWRSSCFINPDPVSEEVKEFTEGLWNSHKSLIGVQLSNATHGPGEPWTIIRDMYGSLDNKPRIPNELIRDVFKEKYNSQSA